MQHPVPYDTFGGSHGPAIHFAHANAYTPKCYRQLLERLGERSQVFAAYHRPLWDPNFKEFSNWVQSADDLIAFLEQQQLSQVIGIGHSYGGIVTTIAAGKRPDLFSKVIVLDPVLLIGFPLLFFKAMPQTLRPLFLSYIRQALNRVHQWDNRVSAFDYFRSKKAFSRFSDEALRDVTRHGLKDNPDGTVELVFSREWEAQLYKTIPGNMWEYVTGVKQPLMGLVGVKSYTTFENAFNHWRRTMPRATLERIPAFGHLFPLEYPEETARRILDYLDLDAGTATKATTELATST